ncbi:MAG: hypothetical protein ACREEM_29590 [Blastocatellia bacterium]
MQIDSTVFTIFSRCVEAIQDGKLIRRESRQDKEFHFQNWFSARLEESSLHHEIGGRNSYPDFRMVKFSEGYEVKGLAYPGRELNYDCNSQVPSGSHNGRAIFYVFGRYPSEPDGDTYPVLDMVFCHGDFLNADHEYIHKNKSLKGFGSYGDIMIRDRKMYVAPTPFGLIAGVAHTQTLILPEQFQAPRAFKQVGQLVRKETDKLIVGYKFDLKNNVLSPDVVPNPATGKEHRFSAWRLRQSSGGPVLMRTRTDAETANNDDAEE